MRYAGATLFGFIALSQWLGLLLGVIATGAAFEPGMSIPLVFGAAATALLVRWWCSGAMLNEQRLVLYRLFSTQTFLLDQIGGIAVKSILSYGENPQYVDSYVVLDRKGNVLREIDSIRILRNYEELVSLVNASAAGLETTDL